jgi:hypothetical protein
LAQKSARTVKANFMMKQQYLKLQITALHFDIIWPGAAFVTGHGEKSAHTE